MRRFAPGHSRDDVLLGEGLMARALALAAQGLPPRVSERSSFSSSITKAKRAARAGPAPTRQIRPGDGAIVGIRSVTFPDNPALYNATIERAIQDGQPPSKSRMGGFLIPPPRGEDLRASSVPRLLSWAIDPTATSMTRIGSRRFTRVTAIYLWLMRPPASRR